MKTEGIWYKILIADVQFAGYQEEQMSLLWTMKGDKAIKPLQRIWK